MTTPMMQQYRSIKQQVPDAILFFRLGDFYEMFGEDAEQAAPILEIALTGRDAGDKQRIPMCGVPYHAVDNYLGKLVSAGLKVAICEQVEDPRQVKGIVKREIVRIVSPGTLTDNLLPDKNNNYLASIYFEKEWGLSFLDISTGEFNVFQTPQIDILLNELARIQPAELLLPPELQRQTQYWSGYFLTIWPRHAFINTSLIVERFSAQNEVTAFPAAIKAASALWNYLGATRPGLDPAHILEITICRQGQTMILDQWTRRNLELTQSIRGDGKKGTLLSTLDLTKTAFGGRMLKRWIEQPLLEQTQIENRLDTIEELSNNSFLRADLIKLLTHVYDLERIVSKVTYGSANARDLLTLANTLSILPALSQTINLSEAGTLKHYLDNFEGLDGLTTLLQTALDPEAPSTLKEGNLIKTGYSNTIDELRSVASGGKEWLAHLENSERERTGIRSLKIGYNKVFGYFIEVTHANSHLVPEDYQRKQTLANAERFVTQELKEYESKILGAEDKLIELEYQIFLEMREAVRLAISNILRAARALAEIDVYVSLAEVSVRNQYIRPTIADDGKLAIIEGRHPVVEHTLSAGTFVPNDTVMSNQHHLAIITGPNMAGKSTYMRQVAIIVLLAHVGCFVPAQRAHITLVDRIYTRIGASDDLASGQSTFMVEMQEVAHILKHATNKSLVVLDEIGRGTATFDGLSIAWAVAEYLVETPGCHPKTLFATHYHELTQLESSHPGIFNLHVAVREAGEEVIFLHRILPGKADRSYGIQVARLAGLPSNLLSRAKHLLRELEEASSHDLGLSPVKLSQPALFDVPDTNPLLQEVSNLNLDDFTPRQALDYLFDLQTRAQTLEIL